MRISFFEYISVGVAFVLSFGVVRLLDGIPHALHREKRYWPHSLWIAIKFVNHFAIWWTYWALRDLEWTYGAFLAQLGTPIILYLQASALVTSRPEAIEDWCAHFHLIRRRFFGLNAAFVLVSPLSNYFAAGELLMPPSAIAVSAVALAISIVGFLFESHRVQSVLVLTSAAFNSLAVATVFGRPV